MSRSRVDPLAPGAVIGILGGGQLGRMTALAAAQLGYRCHVYGPEPDSPAAQVTSRATAAAYDDRKALAEFAEAVDVATFEFENIPHAAVEFLDGLVPVRPKPAILRICQNRLREKEFCHEIGVPTARYAKVTDLSTLVNAVNEIGRPCVLKTAELGYDGKGQVLIGHGAELEEIWAGMAETAATRDVIVEAFVDFRVEISLIVARGLDGARQTYVPVETQHKNHVLHQTIVPVRLPQRLTDKAEGIARHMAEVMDLVGLLAIEMFVTSDDELLINELAPRPHNSVHWTLDACMTSQFEQCIRAIAGLPLGSSECLTGAVMTNLLGDEIAKAGASLRDPRMKLHLYNKAEVRPGRKMGHLTRLIPRD